MESSAAEHFLALAWLRGRGWQGFVVPPSAGVMRILGEAETGAEGCSRIIDHIQLPPAGSLKGKPGNANTNGMNMVSQDLKASNQNHFTIKTSGLWRCLLVPNICEEIFVSQLTTQGLRLAPGQ